MPRIRVDSVALYYEEVGAGAPVVLLHGLGSCGADWEPQLPGLVPGYRVLLVDLRGHGRSSKPDAPYSVPVMARDIARLLDSLELGPAHIVGLSMGGMVAFQLALDAPERVASLTLVNTTPDLSLRSRRERFKLRRRLLGVRVLGMSGLGRVLARRLLPGPQRRDRRRTFVARYAQNEKGTYLAVLDGLVGWSVADRLESIACPVLVVAAEHDYAPVADKRAYAARMPRAELVVLDGARHAAPAEQPDAFNCVLRTFLDRVAGS